MGAQDTSLTRDLFEGLAEDAAEVEAPIRRIQSALRDQQQEGWGPENFYPPEDPRSRKPTRTRGEVLRGIQQKGSPDDFQTPAYGVEPLLRYLPADWHVWEPACGKGNIVRALDAAGYSVVGTDILDGTNFLTIDMEGFPYPVDCIVTNPPFTLKDAFIARCYALGKPWALLMPLGAMGGVARQRMWRERGVQVIMLGGRIDFETPSGQGSGSWFETAWFTWGFNLPSAIVWEQMHRPRRARKDASKHTEEAAG